MLYPELLKGMSWDEFLKTLTVKTNLKSENSEITQNDLADLFAEIEYENQRVATVMLNAIDYSIIRKWNRNITKPEQKEKNLKKGIMADIWGAHLTIYRTVPVHTIIALGEPKINGSKVAHKCFVPRLAAIMQLKSREFRFEECKRCGWKWIPRMAKPVLCPKCKSAYWNIEKKRKN